MYSGLWNIIIIGKDVKKKNKYEFIYVYIFTKQHWKTEIILSNVQCMDCMQM